MRPNVAWIPSDRHLIMRFAPLGKAARLSARLFTIDSIKSIDWRDFRETCLWMGVGSVFFVITASIFISLALTLQTISEMNRFRAADLAGSVIAVGLLRELGPLTVSLAWSARTSARISQEAMAWHAEERQAGDDLGFARDFVVVRLLAAITMGTLLSIYGLIVGFISAAVAAPIFGANSSGDFLEAARLQIKSADLAGYFLKVSLVNPIIAVLAGCLATKRSRDSFFDGPPSAVTATFVFGYMINFVITLFLYFRAR